MTQKKQLVKSNKKINRDKAFEIITDVIIFLIVVLIFGFALLAFFPGFVTSDNVDQLNQAFTNNYNPGHPIIHSIIIGSLTKLAGASGIWVVGVVQIILFALIWTYCCKTTRKYNNSEIINFLQIGLTLVISIIPINFMYSIILWKDILYTYSILLLLPLIYVGIKEKYNYNIIQIILISLSCVGIMKLRKNGLPIGFIMFVILMILTIVKTKSLKKIATFLISFILIFMCFTIPEKVVKSNSSKGGKVLDSTKLYCLATLIDKGVEIDNEDYEFLNQLIDVEKMKANYDDFSGNGIFWGSDLDNSFLTDEENSKKFSEIFYKYAMKNKELVIKHFGKLNSIWWSIKEYGPMNTIVTDNAYLGIMEYENHSLYQKLKEKLNTYIFKTQGNNILYYLMYRPATMLYLSIILVVAIIIKQRKTDEKGYILLTFPMILNIGTYIILITSQDLRYFYPTHITAYFLILVFLSTFINKKKTGKSLSKIKK